MSGIESIVPAVVGVYLGRQIVKIRERGRMRWLTPVGHPPRDLFASRRVKLLFNLVYEWLWIGFALVIASFFMIFFELTDGLVFYVMDLGFAMMAICAIVVPLCLARADLNPKYADLVEASPA